MRRLHGLFMIAVLTAVTPALASPASPELRQGWVMCIQHSNRSGGWVAGWEQCSDIAALWAQTDEALAAAKEAADHQAAVAAAMAQQPPALIKDLATGKVK